MAIGLFKYLQGDENPVPTSTATGTSISTEDALNQLLALYGDKTAKKSQQGGSNNYAFTNALNQAKFLYQQQQDAASAATNAAKLGWEKEQYADVKAAEAAKLKSLQEYYHGNTWATPYSTALAALSAQRGVDLGDIEDLSATSRGDIRTGYETASGQTSRAYDALDSYLRANPNNPYVGMTARAGTSANDTANFLQAYGVDSRPVAAQVEMNQLNANQSAANYQNLLDTLRAISQQSSDSRLSASMASRTGMTDSMSTMMAQALADENRRKMAALAQVAKEYAANKAAVEQAQAMAGQQIAQAIAAAGGSVVKPPTSTSTSTTPTASDAWAQILFGDNYALGAGLF